MLSKAGSTTRTPAALVLAATVLLVALAPGGARAAETRYEIDPEHFSVGFGTTGTFANSR